MKRMNGFLTFGRYPKDGNREWKFESFFQQNLRKIFKNIKSFSLGSFSWEKRGGTQKKSKPCFIILYKNTISKKNNDELNACFLKLF